MLNPEEIEQDVANTREQMMHDAIRSMYLGAKLGDHPNVLEFIGAADTYSEAGPTLVHEFIDGLDIDEYFQVTSACVSIPEYSTCPVSS